MMDGKRLSTRLSLTIVFGPICHCLSHPVNPNVQIVRDDSPIQSSHASKRIKTDIPPMQDKGKAIASPSSPSNDSSKSVFTHAFEG
jgi:hypothetical protein